MFRSLDHPQGTTLFLAKVIVKHSQNSFILTGCCGSMLIKVTSEISVFRSATLLFIVSKDN